MNLVERLIAVAVFLQSLEMLILQAKNCFKDPWSRRLNPSVAIVSILMIGAASWSLQFGGLFPFAVMAAGAWIVAYHFGGTFNGGSDSMTFYILNAVILGRMVFEFRDYALMYIALLICFSYFVAGISKLNSPAWRSGVALSRVLQYSNAVIPRPWLQRFSHSPSNLKAFAWATMAFEILFPLVLLWPASRPLALAAGVGFHLVNFYVFGLNRFFFAWIAGYPAIYLFGR